MRLIKKLEPKLQITSCTGLTGITAFSFRNSHPGPQLKQKYSDKLIEIYRYSIHTKNPFSLGSKAVSLAGVWVQNWGNVIRCKLPLILSACWLRRHRLCILWRAVVLWGGVSSVSKQCQLGWVRTVGGEIWERNKLNLADTLFSFPNEPVWQINRSFLQVRKLLGTLGIIGEGVDIKTTIY